MFVIRRSIKTFLTHAKWAGNCSTARIDRCLHATAVCCCKDKKDEKDTNEEELSGSISSKYEIFVDYKSPIIFDIEQEREKFYEVTDESDPAKKNFKDFAGISTKRGETGVFDVNELVAILNKEKALDLTVIKIPEEYAYVDYFVIVTCKSRLHMKGIAEFIRKVWKLKTNSEGIVPSIEGADSKDWKALDLGNIALHIMSESAREFYDLESLWSIGKEYDTKSNIDDDDKHYSYASVLSKLMPVTEVS